VTGIGDRAFEKNKLTEVIIHNPTVTISPRVFDLNQTTPSDLTIYGHIGPTAESLAKNKGYTFLHFLL